MNCATVKICVHENAEEQNEMRYLGPGDSRASKVYSLDEPSFHSRCVIYFKSQKSLILIRSRDGELQSLRNLFESFLTVFLVLEKT